MAGADRCPLLGTPGQWGDNPQFQAVLKAIRVPREGQERPRSRPDSVPAEKAYRSRRARAYLRRHEIAHTIPEPRDQRTNRKRRGLAGGRSTGFDKERYKKRNVVERAINRLKGYRAVATRYDKRVYVYLGTTTVAALLIWLRT